MPGWRGPLHFGGSILALMPAVRALLVLIGALAWTITPYPILGVTPLGNLVAGG